MPRRKHINYWHICALIGIALVVCVPFIWLPQIYNQDDLLFHKARLLHYYTSVVQQHDLVPYVFADMANHFGYAADTFYNSLALLPFLGFKLLLGGFVLPYQLYLATLSIGTALVAYCCGRQVFDERAALAAAALYTANTYRLIDVFLRGALGESLAYLVLPIVALGLVNTVQQRGWRTLAVGMSLLWLVHPLSAVMAAVLLAVLDVVLWLSRELAKQAFKQQVQAALAWGLLTCFSTLPTLEQVFSQPLTLTQAHQMWAQGLDYSFADLLSNSLSNAAGVWADLAPNIGPLALLVLGYALWHVAALSGAYRVVTGATAALFVLSSNLLLWPIVKQTPLAMIQFEWRLLSFVALGCAILAAATLMRWRYWLIIAAVGLSVSFNYAAVDAFKAVANGLVITDRNANVADSAIGGGYEFLPTRLASTVASDPVAQTLHTAGRQHHVVGHATYLRQDRSGWQRYVVSETQPGSGIVLLAKIDYPGYTVMVGNKRYAPHNVNGLIGIRLSGALPAQVTIRYTKTPVQKISLVAASLAWLALLLTIRRRQHQEREYLPWQMKHYRGN